MEELDKLRETIEKTTRETEREFVDTSGKVSEVKNYMNELEQCISRKNGIGTSQDLKNLDSAIRLLNTLTNSQISRSKEAWEEYRKLERDCAQHASLSIQMDKYRAVCQRMGQLAADLLCYSLARFESSKQ